MTFKVISNCKFVFFHLKLIYLKIFEFDYQFQHFFRYANRAKNIKTKIYRNVRSVDYHVAQYQQVIS